MHRSSEIKVRRYQPAFLFWLLVILVVPFQSARAFDLEHIARNTVSSHSFISPNGRYVAFIGTNLIAASGEVNQAYLYDRDNNTLELISQDATGASANADVKLPKYIGQRAVTDDGRYVVFQTQATNLGATDPGNPGHIYIRNRDAGTTTLVDKSTAGTPGNFPTVIGEFSIAPDGWAVIFNSRANNLDPQDTDNTQNTYLYQVNDGPSAPPPTTDLACFDRNGDKLDACIRISLSCTGTMVFTSGSDTVVSDLDDTHFGNDLFYGIPLNGTNTIISVGPSGEPADNTTFSAPSISCDGNRIAFGTKASLTLADTDTDWDLYVHDLSTGVSGLIRGPSDASLRSSEIALSPDGTWIAFKTKASLDPVDTSNQFFDNVYAISYSRDRLALGTPQLVSQQGGVMGNAVSSFPTVGNFGSVAFQSSSSNFPPFNTDSKILVNGCAPSRLVLDSSTVTGVQTFEACDIFAENKQVMAPLGDLTLKARRIALGSNFSVDAGATVTLENF